MLSTGSWILETVGRMVDAEKSSGATAKDLASNF
jgi:hypothetical protein